MTRAPSTPASTARRHPPRWQRRKEARPAELASAALDLFVERGFSATRLEDVARRAGVTKGTMYLYFDSKEALFKEAVRQAMIPTFERGEERIERHEGPTSDLLRDLVRGWWELIGTARLSGLPKLMMAEASNFPEIARFYHEEIVQRGRRLFGRALERGVARGEFRNVDIPYAVRVIGASVLFAAIWKHSLACVETTPFDAERYLDAQLDLVLHGLERPAGKDSPHA